MKVSFLTPFSVAAGRLTYNFRDGKRILYLSDPVEYNFTEQEPLQGTRLDNMTSLYNSIILYLGFSLNFGEKKKL